MKSITLGILFFISLSVSAYDIELKDSDCSLFGNIKIKVSGLESLGSVSKDYLKNTSTSRSNCSNQLSNLRETFNNEAVYADAKVTKKIVKRTFSGRGIKLMRRDRCEESLITTLTLTIPSYSNETFKNSVTKAVRSHPGSCF
ncbi:hypothetical protein [Halobacteriovorax sp.]|uniref:hypothetical protein n=1 Tax=Halobacteriovorax sp. TaxID=2020862 RepID=UPI0035699CFD